VLNYWLVGVVAVSVQMLSTMLVLNLHSFCSVNVILLVA